MADARLLFPPGWQLTDSTDNPVSAGVIKFFDSGTSNPRTVYSDSALTTSLGTEITTNSAGRPASGGNEVLVYASEGTLTLQALTSASGSIWSFDDHLGALDTSGFSAEVATPDRPVLTKTGNYTAVSADRGSLINLNANPATLTLPSAADVGDGWILGVKNIHATATDVTVATVSSQTIDGSTTHKLPNRYDAADLVSDAGNWHLLAKVFSGGAVNLQSFAVDGTYTPHSRMKSVLVIATGAGGGGGGADTDGTGVGAGGGGEAGGTLLKVWTAAEVGASAAIVVGASGSAGSNVIGTNGGDGGDTTVTPSGTGSVLTAQGGDGGDGSGVETNNLNLSVGGTGESGGTNGDINFGGAPGEDGLGWSAGSADTPTGASGRGGASFWGGGGSGHKSWASATTDGGSGTSFGAGGGGGLCIDSTSGADGGAGAIGIVVVLEFLE